MVKAFIHSASQRLSTEKIAPLEPEPPATTDKITTVILPALLVGGFGGLAIAYPHFLSNFDFHYVRGNGFFAIFMLLFVLFIKLAWNQVGGAAAIALSLLAITKCLLPNKQEPNNSEPLEPLDKISQNTFKQEAVRLGLRTGLKGGEKFIQRHKSRRSQEKSDSSP